MKKNLLLFFLVFSTSLLFGQSGSGDNYRNSRPAMDEVQVFPNPASSYIGFSAVDRTVNRVVVFNLVGREMKNFDADIGDRFFIGDLPNGMYLVQLLDEKNKIIKTQRVNKR